MIVRDDERAVREVIDAFWDGWTRLDASAILATIADRPDTILIGTDATEYWTGKASLAQPFTEMTQAFDEERVEWEPGAPLVSVGGDVAWATGRLDVAVRIGEDVAKSAMRASFVLVRDGGGWAIVHAHFSVAPASPVAEY